MILSGKRVLVTGGARRCGALLVRRFAEAGASVILHCNRSRSEAEALLTELPGSGHTLWQADLSRPGEAERLGREAGRFDVLVNNASCFFRPGSPEDLAAADLYDAVHFRAPAVLLAAFGAQELMEGCAVNVLDLAILSPGSGPYWGSRRKLLAETERLALLWGPRNLRVNAVAPGPMLPPSWAPGSRMEKTLPRLPLRRPVSPEDFADAVLFLCRCDSVTGAVLPLGGRISAAS